MPVSLKFYPNINYIISLYILFVPDFLIVENSNFSDGMVEENQKHPHFDISLLNDSSNFYMMASK